MKSIAPHLADEDRWKGLVKAAFEHAFEWLGFGAKTAVGYGAMERDRREEEAARERAEREAARRAEEEKERRRIEAERAEAARRAAEEAARKANSTHCPRADGDSSKSRGSWMQSGRVIKSTRIIGIDSSPKPIASSLRLSPGVMPANDRRPPHYWSGCTSSSVGMIGERTESSERSSSESDAMRSHKSAMETAMHLHEGSDS